MILRQRPRLDLHCSRIQTPRNTLQLRHYGAAAATATVTITPTPPPIHPPTAPNVIQRHHPQKPPSHKPPEMRKSQLLRQYTSLLRSTPLLLLFQHNNLRATEWAAIRRELALALGAVEPDASRGIKLQVVRPALFEPAMRIVERFDPLLATAEQAQTHALSPLAYRTAVAPQSSRNKFRVYKSSLHSLLSGPIATLSFPTLTPSHLAAALRILAPTVGAKSAFPAPRRAAAPGYYEAGVQAGLQKLVLLGARVDGGVMDGEGVRWVGGLPEVDVLRAEVVRLLEGVSGGVVGALEGAGRSLWFAVEGRRADLESKAQVQEAQGGDEKQ